MQLTAFGALEKEPTGHCEQAVDPTELAKFPGEQLTQAEELMPPGRELALPVGHDVQDPEPETAL